MDDCDYDCDCMDDYYFFCIKRIGIVTYTQKIVAAPIFELVLYFTDKFDWLALFYSCN